MNFGIFVLYGAVSRSGSCASAGNAALDSLPFASDRLALNCMGVKSFQEITIEKFDNFTYQLLVPKKLISFGKKEPIPVSGLRSNRLYRPPKNHSWREPGVLKKMGHFYFAEKRTHLLCFNITQQTLEKRKYFLVCFIV